MGCKGYGISIMLMAELTPSASESLLESFLVLALLKAELRYWLGFARLYELVAWRLRIETLSPDICEMQSIFFEGL